MWACVGFPWARTRDALLSDIEVKRRALLRGACREALGAPLRAARSLRCGVIVSWVSRGETLRDYVNTLCLHPTLSSVQVTITSSDH